MKTPLAWKKMTHHKLRTAAAVSGVCFAMVLLFLQLGFYDACYRSSTMVLDQLDYDVALVSPQYEVLRAAGTFPQRRLYQAKGIPGVARALPLYLGNAFWRNPETHFQREVLVMGVVPGEPTFRVPELIRSASQLRKEDTGIWDVKAQKGYGDVRVGTDAEFESRKIRIVDTYAHGSGFISPSVLVVSDQTLFRALATSTRADVSIGLVQLQPGADVEAVVRGLKARLPGDVQVMSRAELEGIDQHYFVKAKPLGIMFRSGVALAVVVGGVILYQILASEIMNNLREYATLRAIGYGPAFLYALVLKQAGILALFGFVPAVFLAAGIYAVTRLKTNLPMFMTADRVGHVVLLSALMCSVSGLLLVRKVSRADPAELF